MDQVVWKTLGKLGHDRAENPTNERWNKTWEKQRLTNPKQNKDKRTKGFENKELNAPKGAKKNHKTNQKEQARKENKKPKNAKQQTKKTQENHKQREKRTRHLPPNTTKNLTAWWEIKALPQTVTPNVALVRSVEVYKPKWVKIEDCRE